MGKRRQPGLFSSKASDFILHANHIEASVMMLVKPCVLSTDPVRLNQRVTSTGETKETEQVQSSLVEKNNKRKCYIGDTNPESSATLDEFPSV